MERSDGFFFFLVFSLPAIGIDLHAFVGHLFCHARIFVSFLIVQFFPTFTQNLADGATTKDNIR